MDPRCKGMPLSSFLLKPMQRVTRYPLIIKNVRTASTHTSHALIFSLFSQRFAFWLICFLFLDFRKYSRVSSRSQPPESSSGESRGAVLAGENPTRDDVHAAVKAANVLV